MLFSEKYDWMLSFIFCFVLIYVFYGIYPALISTFASVVLFNLKFIKDKISDSYIRLFLICGFVLISCYFYRFTFFTSFCIGAPLGFGRDLFSKITSAINNANPDDSDVMNRILQPKKDEAYELLVSYCKAAFFAPNEPKIWGYIRDLVMPIVGLLSRAVQFSILEGIFRIPVAENV